MDRREVAEILKQIGILLEINGENFFKCKAYYDAARAIEFIDEDLEVLANEGCLKDIKGFGDALAVKLTELVTTGRLEYYEKLKESVPAGLLEVVKIQGLGAKKVKALYEKLGVSSVDELKKACLDNKLADLQGFGQKTQTRILEGIENLGKYAGRYHFPFAMELAGRIVESLQNSGTVIRCSEAGSLRRRKETVKDMDILASSRHSAAVMDCFTSLPFVVRVTSKGDTKSSVILQDGISVDLRVVDDTQYPYALHHFTGSKEHNTAMRHMAKQEGVKMNEYGLFHGESEELIKCSSEEDIFAYFGMEYIPPELREDNGELEAAKQHKLPKLIKNEDIKGIFHVHTTYSDGINTIEEMVKACMARGYSYLGIADHSQSAHYAGGMKADAVKRQHEEIDKLNLKYTDFRIFKGVELDILPDGNTDYDEDLLQMFDFTIASVHTHFALDEDKMTDRVIKAMKSPYVTMLGHPTGRLLLSREPFKINMKEIIMAAAAEKVILEINANPLRLDIDWRLCKSARDAGCRFAISPDAHRIAGIDDIAFGINVARKGWLSDCDVINSMCLKDVCDYLNI